MTTLARIQKELDRLETERQKLGDQKIQALRRGLIRCMICGKSSRVSAWVFIQTQWYVRPYGCTEGDYWKNSATQLCNVVCPKCDQENYIYNHPQCDTIVALADGSPGKHELFRAVVVRRDRD